MKLAFTFLAIVLGSGAALATEGLFTGIHHHYQSPRALGMGDAFVAVANDYSALFYNPAGLSRMEDGQINLSIDLAASSAFYEFSKDIDTISKITDENEKNTKYIELLQKNYGKPFSVRMGLLHGIWVRPNWGFGILPADVTIDMAVHNQGPPALSLRSYADTTVAYGYGADVKDESIPGRLSWGVTAKFVNRGYFSRDINSLDLAVDSKLVKQEDLREGYTVDADFGILYTPYIAAEGFWSLMQMARPTFGAVVRNVAETGFGQNLHLMNKTDPAEPPEKLYRVLDVGTRWEYPAAWIFAGRGVMDMRDIGHPNFTPRKGFHLGFEFDWSVASWWKGQYRFGVNQGYPTFGVSALLTILRLDLVTYGEDIGSYDNPKENRMYMLKLNVDI